MKSLQRTLAYLKPYWLITLGAFLSLLLVTAANHWREDASGLHFQREHLRYLAPAGRLHPGPEPSKRELFRFAGKAAGLRRVPARQRVRGFDVAGDLGGRLAGHRVLDDPHGDLAEAIPA